MAQGKFRHEFKYISPEYILSGLERRISSLLEADSHAGENNTYSIRSLYFDDMFNSCYYENENGTDPREKFRIRIYNSSSSRISLELKRKVNGMCLKTSCPISLDDTNKIISGGIPDFDSGTPFLLKKLIMEMRSRALKPVVIVSYERVPFIYRDGNVRITFDRNIRSSCDFSGFFDPGLSSRPVMETGTNMIEVKYDELLPGFISESLQTARLNQTSFSKFYICRKFNRIGDLFR